MKLNKKLIIILTFFQFIFMIGIYIFGSISDSKSLEFIDIVLLVFISLIFAILVNVLYAIIRSIVELITRG